MREQAETAEKVAAFFQQYRLRSYTKGQILILNGDKPEHIFHLVTGKVKQYDVSYRGDELILNVFKPPAFFPMSVAINDTPNPYLYEAETNITVHQVPKNEVIEFIKANPDVMFDLLSRVFRGTDGLMGRVSQLMTSNAKSRVLYELIIEAHRFGERLDDGSYQLGINEKDLGARAGLSRETVSRELRKIGSENISVGRKYITIKDLSELEGVLNKLA